VAALVTGEALFIILVAVAVVLAGIILGVMVWRS
jgi:hypothetical protein